MSKNDEDIEIVIMPQVQESMDSDPELAKAMKEFLANVHQANEAVKSGRYESFDDAMEAITGNRPELIELDDGEDDE